MVKLFATLIVSGYVFVVPVSDSQRVSYNEYFITYSLSQSCRVFFKDALTSEDSWFLG